MSPLLRSLKFMWEYFGQGRHRSSGPDATRNRPDNSAINQVACGSTLKFRKKPPMKERLRRLLATRTFCFLAGISTIPILSYGWSFFRPSAKDVMGFSGFYEENISLYTFLGDHTYSLKFPGDRAAFEKCARKLGLKNKVSENEFKDSASQASHRECYSSSAPRWEGVNGRGAEL